MRIIQLFSTFIYGCLILVFLLNNKIYAQSFEPIELASGLNVLVDNNGAAVADYDGDLDLDLFVVAKAIDQDGVEKSFSKLFRNNNDGSFTDVTEVSNLINLYSSAEAGDLFPGLDAFKYGASWGDYDNDGYPDIFFTHSFKVQLFHNQGDGTFREVTSEAGIQSINNCRHTGATWVDYNNDSFLDIFIGDWGSCDGNVLYENKGNGTFVNVSLSSNVGTGSSNFSYTMIPFDFNKDGWLDFYISNDKNQPNSLLINQNGLSFIDQAEAYGLDSRLDEMGIAVGDFNNDGSFDFYVTGININAMFENNGNNIFSEVSESNNTSFTGTGFGWGCKFSDFDLDGDEDLFVVNGFKNTIPVKNVYFENLYEENQNTFLDISETTNLNPFSVSTDAQDFDFDNDGDIDLFVSNSVGNSFMYENKIINGNTNLSWFKIILQGTISNKDAIGSKLSVTTSNRTIVRYHHGIGMLSQSLKPIHFGLKDDNVIDQLEILWPSGLTETYNNLNSNTTLRVIEGQGYEVLNIEPSIKIYGCTDPNSCTYNPLATSDDGSCILGSDQEIIGETESGFNNIEIYNYQIKENSEISWLVEGGELLSGQGSNSITVKWGLESIGKIIVTESLDGCSNVTTVLEINLSLDIIPDNISIARIWNEALLEAIRRDFARPTVHARNLFHTSVALYDSWAIYSQNAKPYLIGNIVNEFQSKLNIFVPNESNDISISKTMSYAAYRLLTHRFVNSPGGIESLKRFDYIMNQLGYDINNTTLDYESGDAAALGNYIGSTLINYGLIDGSNEINDYSNSYYQSVNPPLSLNLPNQTTGIINPNRWQPLSFDTFIDQSNNIIPGSTPSFLGPEWGKVLPFALNNKSLLEREGNIFHVYHLPEMPPQLDVITQNVSSDQYKWNFTLVAKWSSHLDATDGVMWDISPNSIGNIDFDLFPNSYSVYSDFYDYDNGGDISNGHNENPSTGASYEVQLVPRGDYTRVLAEFWADGPDSETPPGHWFTILNYVNDHPKFERKFNGIGDVLPPLEWDVKAYFILAGAMHDSAITAWGIKGWFDYIRPISAIRYMSELGQSTDPNLINYNPGGIPLVSGFIEVIQQNDPLIGDNNENLGKMKIHAWLGHDAINDANTDVAGVGWILAENWWPYQRPSFVTPPFAGFVSGHSTFSRAAAEVMTLITGDAFFPGGMGEFVAKKDEFLVFEKGPSVDVKLQWATYRDASDQTSLSRIWGGIHPPVDDISGRIIGKEVGINAFNFALPYFDSELNLESTQSILVYPNPVLLNEVYISNTTKFDAISLFDLHGRQINFDIIFDDKDKTTQILLPKKTISGVYILKVNTISKMLIVK